jgi:hypothetical protein
MIFDELEQVTHVLFFQSGIFDVGFDLNGKKNYALRYKNMVTDEKAEGLQYNAGEPIGDYGCTYNKSSRFVYMSRTQCEGF